MTDIFNGDVEIEGSLTGPNMLLVTSSVSGGVASGVAMQLPPLPAGYLCLSLGGSGTTYAIPYYNLKP